MFYCRVHGSFCWEDGSWVLCTEYDAMTDLGHPLVAVVAKFPIAFVLARN